MTLKVKGVELMNESEKNCSTCKWGRNRFCIHKNSLCSDEGFFTDWEFKKEELN